MFRYKYPNLKKLLKTIVSLLLLFTEEELPTIFPILGCAETSCLEPELERRPAEPTQQYLTVDELQNEMFSFGLDRQGNRLRFDLGEFRNSVNSSSELYALINKLKEDSKNQFPEFSPKDSPFIISRHEIEEHYNGDWSQIQNGHFPKLLRTLIEENFKLMYQTMR